MASSSCRILEKVSNDDELNNSLRNDLSRFINLDKTQLDMKSKAGLIFSIREFSMPFSTSIEELNSKGSNVKLVFKSNREDKQFRSSSNIQEVGIGYSRAYIMYKVSSANNYQLGNQSLELSDDSYVSCKVYE